MHILKRLFAVAIIASAAYASIAIAEDAADCASSGQPAQLDAKVEKVDATNGKITVRDSSGTVHEFDASAETLQDYKVGDTIKAKLRCEK